MFKIYDLNLNEIPFPDGVKPLDIIVGSISKRRETEPIPGRSGVMNYGFDYDSRPVDLSLWLEAKDSTDYRLIRNELYDFIDRNDVFYVCETRLPSRVLKVCIDESYIPDRLTVRHSTVDITCKTLDSVFWESTYTTMDLHNSGFSSTPDKYGLVDNIDINKLQYRFEPENTFNPNLIPLNQGDWENGSRWSSGTNNNAPENIRLKMESAISITVGQTYTIKDDSPYNSRIHQFMVHVFDSDGNMVQYFIRNRGASNAFTAEGTRLAISLIAMDGLNIPLDYVGGDRIRIKLERGSAYTGIEPRPETFTVYNAGNVTIEPESMMLNIIANTVYTDGDFTIKNLTTGEVFIFKASLSGVSLLLRGVNVLVSSINNRFRDSNKQFISLAPGDNEFEVSGGTFNHIRFDFKYLYK